MQSASVAQNKIAGIAARGADAARDSPVGERVHRQRAGIDGTASADRRDADIVVGRVRQDQRAPADLGQPGVVRTGHQAGKLDRSIGIDLNLGRARAAIDQGKTAIGAAVRTARIVQRAAFENQI